MKKNQLEKYKFEMSVEKKVSFKANTVTNA